MEPKIFQSVKTFFSNIFLQPFDEFKEPLKKTIENTETIDTKKYLKNTEKKTEKIIETEDPIEEKPIIIKESGKKKKKKKQLSEKKLEALRKAREKSRETYRKRREKKKQEAEEKKFEEYLEKINKKKKQHEIKRVQIIPEKQHQERPPLGFVRNSVEKYNIDDILAAMEKEHN